jgi:hypothetical protein
VKMSPVLARFREMVYEEEIRNEMRQYQAAIDGGVVLSSPPGNGRISFLVTHLLKNAEKELQRVVLTKIVSQMTPAEQNLLRFRIASCFILAFFTKLAMERIARTAFRFRSVVLIAPASRLIPNAHLVIRMMFLERVILQRSEMLRLLINNAFNALRRGENLSEASKRFLLRELTLRSPHAEGYNEMVLKLLCIIRGTKRI